MKIISFFICLLLTTIARAQFLKVSAGTDLTIMSGTMFKADSLMLTPSVNFTISDNSVIKSDTIINGSENPHILRVYQFTNNTGAFTGSVQVDYTDGAELNGIPENSLTLNIYDGTSWKAFAPTTRDGTNNFVLTNGLSAVNINEITLANSLTPLPLVWLSFTATKQNQTVLLQWATAREQNTRNFAVQHSSNGIHWTDIGTLPAAGNSSIASNYSYVHTHPVTGVNYYRILQTDMDNRSSYSNIRTLKFTNADESFALIANPVTNNVLTVQVNAASTLALYSNDGKLMWQEQATPGIKYIDVSRYPKGVYLLKTNFSVQKVIIQ